MCIDEATLTYSGYTHWLYKHTKGAIDLRDFKAMLPKSKREIKKSTKIIVPTVHINDVDRFCEIF